MTLNLALVISGQSSGARQAVQETRAEVSGLGADAQRASATMVAANDQAAASAKRVTDALTGQSVAALRVQQIVNSWAGIRLPGDDGSYRQREADINAYGQALDAIRARYNPLFAASKEYEGELDKLNEAQKLGAISSQEHEAALAALNDRYTGLYRQSASAAGSLGAVGGAARLTSTQLLNLSRQGNDVITMLALGANAEMVFATQAGQIYDALESGPKGLRGSLEAIATGAKNAGTAFLGFLATPAGIATASIAALTAGLGAYVLLSRSGIKSVDDVLAAHKALIDEITHAYPLAAEAAKAYEDAANKLPQSVAGADTARQIEDEKAALAATLNDLRLQLQVTGSDVGLLGEAGASAFADIGKGIQDGSIDAVDLQKRLGELRVDPSLSRDAKDFATSLQDAANRAATLELRLQGSNAAGAVFQGSTVGRGGEGTALQDYLTKRNETLYQLQRQQDAGLAGIGARSPQELADAARRNAALQNASGESPEVQQYRQESAAALAYAQAVRALTDAQDERTRSLNDTLASSRLDLDLIGKTAGQQAQMRLQFQLYQQVYDEAARNHVQVDQAELDRINEKTAAYGKLVEQTAKAQLASDAAFERDQLLRNDQDQQIASRLQSAARPVDLDSYEAGLIRANLQLKEQKQAWQDIRDVGRSAIDDLFNVDNWQNWGDTGKKILNDVLNELLQFSAVNPIKNALYGDNLPTLQSVGGLGGFIGTLLGAPFKGGSSQSVGAMTVNAGSVVVTGSLGVGGGTNDVVGNVTRLLTGGNDNATAATAGGGDVQSTVWNYFAGKGLSSTAIAGIMGNISAESSFNPSALNQTSGAYGLFQNLGSRLTGLGSGADLTRQLDYAWQELQSSEKSVLDGLMKATNVRQATSAFAGFERAGGWSRANPEGIDNWNQRLNDAQGALERFQGTVTDAGRGLGTFGQGLGNLGSALNQYPAAPALSSGGASASLFDIGRNSLLGSLFGGSTGWGAAGNWLSANPGDFIGLWDSGGWTGPGGKYDPAGIVHRDEYVFSKEATRAIGVSNLDRLHGAAKRGFASGGFAGDGWAGDAAMPSSPGQSRRGGKTQIHVSMDAGLRAQIVQEADEHTIQLIQQNDKYKQELYRNGGQST